MKDANELRHELRQHTGGEQIFRHSLNAGFNYTEGVRAFAQQAGGGAYWLLDILATQPEVRNGVKQEGFCVMLLTVHEDGPAAEQFILAIHDGKAGLAVQPGKPAATLTVSTDAETPDPTPSNQSPLSVPSGLHYQRPIDYTDCPKGQWKFYLTWTNVGGREVVLAMLPSEY